MGLVEIIQNIRLNYTKDGKISWLICFSALLANAIVIGIDSSFGETLGSIIQDFNSTEGNVSWIGSVHSSSQYFSASISSILAKHYGFGPIMFLGIFLSSVFFALCTTASDVSTLAIYYGILGGIGLGFIYTPGNIICSFHFAKRRSLATGIALCGSGLGIALVSFVANIIDTRYGWKACFIFFATACPICGLLAGLAILFPEKGFDDYTLISNGDRNSREDYENKSR